MCKNWREKGTCKYGEKCLFAHGESELTKRSSLNGPEPKKPEPVKPPETETKESSAVPEKVNQEPVIVKEEETKQPELHKKEEKLDAAAESVKLGGPIFETPLKTEQTNQTPTPAFSSSQDMSTMHSTG